MLEIVEKGKLVAGRPKADPPGPQPSVYPETVPHAVGDPRFKLLPSTRMWDARDPAYPAVSTTWPGSWCSTFTLNCWTRPCLKLVFCERIVPVNELGSGGAGKMGKPCDTGRAGWGVCLFVVAQADVADGQPPPKANASDSA